ncbi:MAG TPA: hypothetical protein ENN17_09960, partial [bacterium]|nr:hypothetical protein [bacterium]
MFKRVAPAVAAIGILFFMIRCEIKNPAENLKLIISFSPVSTAVAVEVTDPRTQEYVPGEVTIRIEGPDRAFVVDETGKSLRTLTTSTGIVSFAISDEITPTPENPVSLFLVVEADGYLTTGKTVLIQDTERQAVTVHLVSVQDPPP